MGRSILCVCVLWCCCRRCGDSLIDMSKSFTRAKRPTHSQSTRSRYVSASYYAFAFVYFINCVHMCLCVCVCTELVAANTHAAASRDLYIEYFALFAAVKILCNWNASLDGTDRRYARIPADLIKRNDAHVTFTVNTSLRNVASMKNSLLFSAFGI